MDMDRYSLEQLKEELQHAEGTHISRLTELGYRNSADYKYMVSQMEKVKKEISRRESVQNDKKKREQLYQESVKQTEEAAANCAKSCAAMNKSGVTLDSNKLTDIAGIAMAKLGDIGEGIADTASDIWDKISDGLTAGDSDSIIPGWMSKLGSSIADTASGFADTAADIASGAANYLSGFTDKLGNGLLSAASKSISTATNMVNKVSGMAADAANWFNELTSSFTETDPKKKKKSDVKSAFVASNNKKGVDNSKSPLADLGVNLTKLKNKAFDKFAELAGPVNNLKDAIKNVKKTVTCTVQSAFRAGTAITKSISNTVSSVLAPVKSTITTARNLTNPNNIQAMVTGALDFLPSNVSKMVGKIAYNKAAKYNTKLGMLEGKVNGIDSLGTKIQGLLKYNENSPELLNDAGKLILGLATGDVSKKDLDQLYKAATGYCNNVATPSYLEFGNNKLVYETLLKQALKSGSSHLVSQLANCGKYFSNETKKNIADEFLDTAKKGDVTALNLMLGIAGTDKVGNIKELARTLGTNLLNDTSGAKGEVIPDLVKQSPMTVSSMGLDDEPISNPNLTPVYNDEGILTHFNVADINKHYREQYLAFVAGAGMTPDQLLRDDELPSAYSAEFVTLYARQPELLKEMGMSNTKRNTILNVYTHYMQA